MLLMLPVLTLLVASPVPVTWDTLEMALSVWVSSHVEFHEHDYPHLSHECATGMSNCAGDATCTNTPVADPGGFLWVLKNPPHLELARMHYTQK